ncbi:MAG: ParB/RepB/Spo0J family partition protein [Eubacteriales bacterium]|nr:ParB/RepB/Spo0J family partition protein [Eubacteriales bacterium]
MNNLQNISVNKIYPHPDNPRKDLGDLTELAGSIKAKGILQNLTVVPQKPGYCTSCQLFNGGVGKCTEDHDKNHRPPCPEWKSKGNYTVVIGHRRLAAAKLAGLEEVPCVISDMDHKEQVATMLLENIQRSDLTPIEQANGFQMMMDLGETVSDIAEKTGFAYSTIRRRLDLAKLDQEKLRESYARGGTMMDYAKLEQLKDEKAKNEVLEFIGTRDFEWQLNRALDDQEKPERKEALLEVLDEFATKVKSLDVTKGGYTYEKYFGSFDLGDWEKPEDADTAEYYYVIDNHSASLYKKVEKAPPREISAEEKDFNRREAELKKLSKRAYELRYEFVKNFSAGKKHTKEIQDFTFRRMLRYGNSDTGNLFKILDIKTPDIGGLDYQQARKHERSLIFEKYKESPERTMLLVAYSSIVDSASNNYYHVRRWENKIAHIENQDLNVIYDALISLGYEMSTEERRLQDGSHELFGKED